MMKIKLSMALSGIPILFLIFSGCGKKTVGNDEIQQGSSAITVTVQDNSGRLLPGFEISTQPATRSIFSDSTGYAALANIPKGTYDVSVKKIGFPNFSKEVTVDIGEIQNLLFTYIPSVNVSVHDEKGRSCPGAKIITSPPTYEFTTNQNGTAICNNMPQTFLQFTVKRVNYTDTILDVPAIKPAVDLVVASASPIVTIVSPIHDTIIPNPSNVILNGGGYDMEDGVLSDSSLVWNSDRDGKLGYGQTLLVPYLSPGNHKITLQGTDSDKKTSQTVIPVIVKDFQLNSYFPIPSGETWSYRYMIPEFYITNQDKNTEFWSIQDISVRIDGFQRITELYWDVTVQQVTIHRRLTLTDYMEVENGNIYITKTTETTREWKGILPSYLNMNVTTNYTPRYLFLKNIMNVPVEKHYETTSQSETLWSYVYYSEVSENYHEINSLTTSILVEDEKSIQTDKGIFSAVNLTITQKNAVKKWSLTKGIGLVRIEDNTFDPTAVAVLREASIYRFYTPPAQKTGVEPAIGLTPPVHLNFEIDRTSFESMRTFEKFLVGLCPR
jgi:hypothetical protein